MTAAGIPFEVRALPMERVRELYERRMTRDFPRNELKPLDMLERAARQGRYDCYGAMAGEEILAYALFVRLEDGQGRCALLDYYAVRDDLRDRGVGSAFLRALVDGPLSGLDWALLEVDDPDLAPDALERERRNRRLDFYLRNGMADTSVRAAVYGARFRVLSMPVGEKPSPGRTAALYEALYRVMLTPEMYRRLVRIDDPESA